MKEGFDAFKGTIDLTTYAVRGYPGIFLFAFIGLAATVIMQSSHATLVLIITALAAQQITYENALSLAIGSNIGTTVTAVIGSLGSNVNGRRLAGAHLIFNAVTAIVAIAAIHQLTHAVDWLSEWIGIPSEDYTLKLAVFHTLFNLLGIVLMLPFINPMVKMLNRVVRPHARIASQPCYLNTANSELLDTAIEAVRMETLRLYDNAAEIIAGGLSLPLNEILSKTPMEDVIANHRKQKAIDIDDQYNQSVKSLYGDIVKFISGIQSKMPPDQNDAIFSLRTSGRNIIEAIKDIKHLQKNFSRYSLSDNAYIRKEYDLIRERLASVLRAIDLIRHDQEGDSRSILSLDVQKVTMLEWEDELDRQLNSLIRTDLITPAMSISLMNDSGYASSLAANLLQMGEILFSTGDHGQKEAARSVSLDKGEVEEFLQESKQIELSDENEHS